MRLRHQRNLLWFGAVFCFQRRLRSEEERCEVMRFVVVFYLLCFCVVLFRMVALDAQMYVGAVEEGRDQALGRGGGFVRSVRPLRRVKAEAVPQPGNVVGKF